MVKLLNNFVAISEGILSKTLCFQNKTVTQNPDLEIETKKETVEEKTKKTGTKERN